MKSLTGPPSEVNHQHLWIVREFLILTVFWKSKNSWIKSPLLIKCAETESLLWDFKDRLNRGSRLD